MRAAVTAFLGEICPTAVLALPGADGRVAMEAEWLVMPADYKPVLAAPRAAVKARELLGRVLIFLQVRPLCSQPFAEAILGQIATFIVVKNATSYLMDGLVIDLCGELSVQHDLDEIHDKLE